jgi:hypothetical protein
MLSPKDVKQHLARIIDDLDAGRAPRRHRSPWWVRSLAGPAALGLAFGLGGCLEPVEPDPPSKSEVRDAYDRGAADELCDEIDALAGCDLCDELGYYGDEVCDDFCPSLDEDCGAVALYSAPMECDEDADCPDGMYCDGASSCPEGVYCILPPTPGVCAEVEPIDCEDDADCPDGMHCEDSTGSCPEGAYCILPPTPGHCEEDASGGCPEGAYCILPPTPSSTEPE